MRALRRIRKGTPAPAWQRDVRLLAVSRGISMAGAEAGHIALLALAWQLTGSPSQASIVLLASVVARTAGAPLAGWIGDRFDRKRVIVAAELGVAAALATLAMAQTLAQVLVASLFHAFAACLCGAALDAALPNLVPKRELTRANSTLGMARTTGHMAGPLLGGLLVAAFGARSAFLMDAASSLLAAALVLGIRGSTRGGSVGAGVAERAAAADRDMLAGLRLLALDPVLRTLCVGWAALCVCFAFVTAAELPLAVQFGWDEMGLGAIATCWCAGSLVGAWLARRVRVEQRGAPVLAINAAVCAVVFAAAGVVPSFVAVLMLMAVGGLSMSLADVVEATMVQQRVPDDVRARVMAAYSGLMSAVWGLNLALAGLFIELTSPGAAYVYGAAWCLLGVAGFVQLAAVLRRELLTSTLRVLRPRHALESELAEGA